MAANLFTPILNDRMRSIHFFNGRLLTGEDMTAEQRGQDAVHELLAQSIGDGIVRGLEVSIDASTTLAEPIVKVTQGVAINRKGETLYLPSDTRVQLVRTADATPPARTLFTACTPPESGVYVAGAGVYLLTLCSTVAADGSASVSGLGGQPTGCNTRFAVDAVQFRLIELPMTDAEMQDVARLRNLVAYRCFGETGLPSFALNPFLATTEPTTLLDQLRTRTLTDCDMPLATIYWTATGGLVWLDMWSVRRRTARRTAPTVQPLSTDRRRSTAEAMVLQFQSHVAQLRNDRTLTTALGVKTYFAHLPPIGLLPLFTSSFAGINIDQFFAACTTHGPTFVDTDKVASLYARALDFPPIDTESREVFWLYLVVENTQGANTTASTRPQGYVMFMNGHADYASNARFNLSLWNYANYALV
jgi:hypothetical protein